MPLNKKILSILFVILLIFCVVGCGSDNEGDAMQDFELPEDELVVAVAKNLGVPNIDSVTYEISEKLYWEAAGVYYKDVAFYENGEVVASAGVNPANGAPLKNVFLYGN